MISVMFVSAAGRRLQLKNLGCVGCYAILLLCCRSAHCSYGNIKQQAYKVETESRSFDDFCKRNNVSGAASCCSCSCLTRQRANNAHQHVTRVPYPCPV
jgi:hypothetical protein